MSSASVSLPVCLCHQCTMTMEPSKNLSIEDFIIYLRERKGKISSQLGHIEMLYATKTYQGSHLDSHRGSQHHISPYSICWFSDGKLMRIFPASRGPSRRGKMKREERDLCRLPKSFLSRMRSRFLKVDGTSFPDAGSLVTTGHVTHEICPRDLKSRKIKTNMAAQKLWHTRCFFSCLSEIGSKRKLSFGRQLLSNSACVWKTLFVTQCPKFKAKVSISVAINPVVPATRFTSERQEDACEIDSESTYVQYDKATPIFL